MASQNKKDGGLLSQDTPNVIQTINIQGEYNGEIKKGLKSGFGEMKFNSGAVYKGHWENDKCHG